MPSNDFAVLRRRKFLEALPLLAVALAGCGNTVTVPVDVRSIVDSVTDAFLKFAPPDLAGKLTALRTQLATGGDWKATARAFLAVAQEVLATGVVPEPYASIGRTALSGIGLILGMAGAPGAQAVTMPQALDAAKQLRDLR